MIRRAIASVARKNPSRFLNIRSLSQSVDNAEVLSVHDGCAYVDSVFPIQLGKLDFRRYLGYLREESLLDSIESRFRQVKAHDFQILSINRHPKDGGVFVNFKYSASDPEGALKTIQEVLQQKAKKDGGLSSWTGQRKFNVWMVRGFPWNEDITNRFASKILKVSFEGPDVHEETLYRVLRPYGIIQNLAEPRPVPAGTSRFSTATFERLSSATIARNVIHGLIVPTETGSTKLRISYEYPIEAHAIRDWISNHPRIFLPILFFLVGTLTYAIFDPIRMLMVEAKMLDWFDLKKFRLYKWLRANTLDRLYATSTPPLLDQEVWKERKDAERSIKAYFADLPYTVAFVHGPQGSGKFSMVQSVLKDIDRKTLVIDCRELQKASSGTQLVDGLAKQTGYWPIFSFLNNMNNLIDLASMGLIGQKAGLSHSVEEQLQQVLDIVASALKNVSSSHRAVIEKRIQQQERELLTVREQQRFQAAVTNGTWHDGRLDCVAGNGVMSELGVGDESFWDRDVEAKETDVSSGSSSWDSEIARREVEKVNNRKEKSAADVQSIEVLPIVIIRNFASKAGQSNAETLMAVLAQWAAKLAESQETLPSKPLNFIAFYDADPDSALSFVKQKLHDANVDAAFTNEDTMYVERLGGRSVDLENLVHKVRSGQTIKEAVDDIISRGLGELRKNAFGDDSEDAKNLPWSREQAWIVLKLLAKQPELPYQQVLLDFPFKGDETPLRSMEQAELITIGTQDGRPSVIRPGKPVYRWVFERLVNDPIFQATQEIEYNLKLIASAEAYIRSYEDELLKLRNIHDISSRWLGSDPTSRRVEYLLSKMMESERKLEGLERKNAELKKTLAKSG